MRTPDIKLSLIVFLFAALSACATPQVSRTTSFGSESQTALFIMGVDVKSSQFRNPHFRFRQFDPQSGNTLEKMHNVAVSSRDFEDYTGGQKLLSVMNFGAYRPLGHSYFVFEIDPGIWFLERVNGSYADGLQTVTTAVVPSDMTVALEATAGQIYYLGEFEISGNLGSGLEIKLLNPDKSAAEEYLKTFPNIALDKINDDVNYSSLECPEKTGWLEEFCNHKEIKVKMNSIQLDPDAAMDLKGGVE